MRIVDSKQEILLIDISTWKGHHEIYFKKILLSLLERQYFVYASCSDNADLRQWLEHSNIQNCSVLDFRLSFIEKFFFKGLSSFDRIVQTLFKGYIYRFSSVSSLLFTRNILMRIGKDIPVFFGDADTSVPIIPAWVAKMLLPSQWVTLAVQPSYRSASSWGKQKSRQRFVAEKLFALASCKAVLTLHPAYLKFFRNRFHEDKFLALPEIIDVTIDKHYEVPEKIYHLAAGRKIISITGGLLPKRNLELFLKAAQNLDPERYFILAIGHWPQEYYTPTQIESIKALSLTLANNSCLKLGYYIAAEGEFNQLLTISDLIYLQYHNHSFSSNILTKAIFLRKPVIIGDNYIMKKVINKYDWAAIAPEEPEQIASAMMKVATEFQINETKYQEFLEDFSSEKFNLTIDRTVKLLMSNC
ncbi:glycosyltransferase family 1 protein [Chamaesiphon polymorphus]|uniref:Glycosyl transferase family 1 domain-containing protein n=1 Tax=Chamaesiphon polymorphus CCALA 037 TaxID=2107692 RepID=A0A2T1GMC5_9CYAN|nr:glycosyltransferase family 1 protein [Chamaesiphon polymorphus]PSB59041.1 hypothetical protein C7B77_02485 [Chamaesiphon polymorphus CCALA 037]